MSDNLVLLHGFTGSPASWDDVVERLEPTPRVIAPPMLGHDPDAIDEIEPPAAWESDDDAPPEHFGEEAFRLFAGMFAQPGNRPAHIAGYSLGARVALMLIATAPEYFRSATLIGVNPGLRTEAERAQRRAADRRWIELLDDGIEPFVDEWERLPLWATQQRLPADVLEAQRAARLSHDPRGLQASLRVTGLAEMPDLRPRLGDVRLPVTLIVGAEDAKFRALAEETAALLPDARVVVVPDAGHNLLLERPDVVSSEIGRHLGPDAP